MVSQTRSDRVEDGKPRSSWGGVNLRDIASTDPSRIRPGRVYRSSERFKFEKTDEQVASTLDLREEPAECKRPAVRKVLSGIFKAPVWLLPDRDKLPVTRSHPYSCPRCSDHMSDLHERKLRVFHVNLLPPRMKLRIYADMPWSIRLRTVVAPLKRQHPKEIIEPRVGDDDVLPYDMLYRQMLDLSKRPIARALRVFSSEDNLPIIVHCAQGRDRTGIIIALLLRALGTDEHSVALDYAETDVRLQKQDDKDAGRAAADEGEVREETVPPNVRVMETMLRHLDDHYGGIMGYLRHIGLTVAEINGIQRNMLKPEATAPLVEHDGMQAALENTQEVGQGVEAPIGGDP